MPHDNVIRLFFLYLSLSTTVIGCVPVFRDDAYIKVIDEDVLPIEVKEQPFSEKTIIRGYKLVRSDYTVEFLIEPDYRFAHLVINAYSNNREPLRIVDRSTREDCGGITIDHDLIRSNEYNPLTAIFYPAIRQDCKPAVPIRNIENSGFVRFSLWNSEDKKIAEEATQVVVLKKGKRIGFDAL